MTAENDAQGMGRTVSRRDVLATMSAIGAASVVGTVPAAGAAGDLVQNGGGFSGLDYYVYEPSWYDGSEDVPLIVALHGCTQTADGFAGESRLNETAEQEGFMVVYPQAEDNDNDCFEWFKDSERRRGNGEAEQIASITESVISNYSIDDEQVFLTGFSAGAGMVTDLVAEYADLYAATAPVAGLAYGAGDGMTDAFTVMSNGTGQAESLGTDAYESMESKDITDFVPTIAIHGTQDTTVDDINREEKVTQALQTNDLVDDGQDNGSIDAEADTVETGDNGSFTWTRREYEDADGNVVVVEISIDGMDHAWPGGSQGGSYTAPNAPLANDWIWSFFQRVTGGSEPPADEPSASATVDPTDPEPGQSVTFDASDSSGGESAIDSYEWDLGDGTTASGETVTHSYDSNGTYEATVTITNEDGGTASDSATVEVSDEPDLYCGTATNSAHVDSGRAYESWGCYYAEGSGDYLGCMGTEERTLQETSEGYFEEVASCDDSGGDDGGDDGGYWWL